MKSKKDIITVAIDSPAAAGAGTQAKLISNEFDLFYLDTGKIYRLIGELRIKNKKKFTYKLVKKKIKTIRLRNLSRKNLLSDKVAISAAIVAKDKNIRKYIFGLSTGSIILKNFFKICIIE